MSVGESGRVGPWIGRQPDRRPPGGSSPEFRSIHPDDLRRGPEDGAFAVDRHEETVGDPTRDDILTQEDVRSLAIATYPPHLHLEQVFRHAEQVNYLFTDEVVHLITRVRTWLFIPVALLSRCHHRPPGSRSVRSTTHRPALVSSRGSVSPAGGASPAAVSVKGRYNWRRRDPVGQDRGHRGEVSAERSLGGREQARSRHRVHG